MKTLLRFKWPLLAAALLTVAFVSWQSLREPDWRASAMADVAFIERLLQTDHPGAFNEADPDFLPVLEATHARAAAWAEQVETPAGYLYALRAMTMPLKDAHLAPQFYRSLPRSRQWPGFFVALNDRGAIEVAASDTAGAPPIGATLLSCDGADQEALYRARIEPFVYRSWLSALAPGDWPWILIDGGNPFLEPLAACEFLVEGEPVRFELDWQPLGDERLDAFSNAVEPRTDPVTGLRFERPDLAWISIASFFDSGEGVSEELEALIDAIEAQRSAIEQADTLVIDVRGNLGGASSAAYEVAAALWGEGFIADRLPYFDSTDWRASPNNLDRIESALLPLRIRFGSDSALFQEVTAIRDGMQAAREAGEDFFVQVQPRPAPTLEPPRPLPARIFFLTDQDCVSACLDFADLMKNIEGVVHIGRETSGDTFYLEVATAELPSGIGQLVYPTAIHRGRDRGINESLSPDRRFPGDISDTRAVVEWLDTL